MSNSPSNNVFACAEPHASPNLVAPEDPGRSQIFSPNQSFTTCDLETPPSTSVEGGVHELGLLYARSNSVVAPDRQSPTITAEIVHAIMARLNALENAVARTSRQAITESSSPHLGSHRNIDDIEQHSQHQVSQRTILGDASFEADLGSHFDSWMSVDIPSYPDVEDSPIVSSSIGTTAKSTAQSPPALTTGRRFACSVNGCHKIFTRKSDCTRHLTTHGPPMFPCTELGCSRVGARAFHRIDKLREHRARYH